MKNKDLKRRIVEISYKHKLSHLGSCLSVLDMIDAIYAKKKPEDKFVLSAGHAGLALYCVLEKYNRILSQDKNTPDAEGIFLHHGVHPDRCISCHIDCSTGSLGHGIGIALGMAIAKPEQNIYCIVSDGECSEGSVWEAFRVQKELSVDNLHVFVSVNGYGAYKKINGADLSKQIKLMSKAIPVNTTLLDFPKWLQGQEAHYEVLDEKKYNELMEVLK